MSLQVLDGVAVIKIDDPPPIGFIRALTEELDRADADPEVGAILLVGDWFFGGLDPRELIARLELTRVPTVAAVGATARGAGLETALSCDHRIASAQATLAFPDVRLGLLPSAGGTQRAPRLIGVGAALTLMLRGEPIIAKQALEMGLIDELAMDDIVCAGRAFARAMGVKPRRRLRARTARVDCAAVDAARRKSRPPELGGLAEHAVIDAVAASSVLPLESGLAFERARFIELVRSEQSLARIHLLHAEREAAQLPDGSEPPPYAVKSCAVIGCGTMGVGIAMSCANVGVDVTLCDLKHERLQDAKANITSNYALSVSKARLTQEQMDARLARIRFATGLDTLRDRDLVIEAVFEDLDIKREVFRAIDGLAPPDATLASNTSTLDLDGIASATMRPAQVIGLHFFSPANVMRLLEIVPGTHTSRATLSRAIAFAQQLGKVPVVAGNSDGFIGNRMLYTYRREAEYLLEEGAAPQRIDAVLKGFGLAMGPFAMSDLAGLDIGWRVRKRKYAHQPPVGRYSTVADALCEAGRFGQKTGAGYFRYNPGDRTPIPDPAVDGIIAEAAAISGITQREISDDEIIKRTLYALVNEGAHIVEEGVAARPSDIDVVYCHGYGFPAWRGGPMRWADTLGLRCVYADVVRLRAVHGEVWRPARLLQELADRDGTFGAWRRNIGSMSP